MPFKSNNFLRISFDHFCFLAFCIYILINILLALQYTPPTWDEFLDFAGTVGVVNHLISILKSNPTDLSTITYDLEWYGAIFKFPSYMIWAWAYGFPVQIPTGTGYMQDFLQGIYSPAIHFCAVLLALSACVLYWKILDLFFLPKPLQSLSFLSLALSPFWLSNQAWNLKDLPIATCLLLATYSVIQNKKNISFGILRLRYDFCIVIALALILASKYAYLPVVMIFAFLVAIHPGLFKPNRKATIRPRSSHLTSIFIFSLLTIPPFFLSLLLTPQAIHNLLYPIQSISYFANHPSIQTGTFHESFEALASRASFLLSPLVVTLIFFVLAGTLLLLLKPSTRRAIAPDPDDNNSTIFILRLTLSLTAFYVGSILLTGRILYGPDLRHLIWLYPLLLLALTLLVQKLLLLNRSLYYKKLVQIVSLIVILVQVIETILIYPHFSSYIGIFPVAEGTDFASKAHHLVISKYLPERSPELYAGLFSQCSSDSACLDMLIPKTTTSSWSLSQETNPDYLSAYVSMVQSGVKIPSFYSRGYTLSQENRSGCSIVIFSRSRITKNFASVATCD